jgi:hypothetical protein
MRIGSVLVPMNLRILDEDISRDNIKSLISTYKQYRKVEEEEKVDIVEEPKIEEEPEIIPQTLTVEVVPEEQIDLLPSTYYIDQAQTQVEPQSEPIKQEIHQVQPIMKMEGSSKCSKHLVIQLLLVFIIILLIIVIVSIKMPSKIIVVNKSKSKHEDYQPLPTRLTDQDELFGNMELDY